MGVFFLSHTVPGFQLWFYFHLWIWVAHWGVLLRLPWRTWVCPREGQVWRWCSCLAFRDSGSVKYAGTWTASTTGVMALSESFFKTLVWQSEGLFGQSFSVAPPTSDT